MALDPSKLRHTTWIATWKAAGGDVVLEATDEVDPGGLEMLFHELKVGVTGPAKLGERFVGAEGMISVEQREIDDVIQRKLTPWAGASGSYSLTPDRGTDLYGYARELVLHPADLPAGTTTEDIHLVKTVPIIKRPKGDGEEDNVLAVEFWVYPDRAALPQLRYGFVGASAPA
jgi:hypothetical protein